MPKRPKPTLKQFRGEHKEACCFGGGACGDVEKGEAEWLRCWCCDAAAHQQCAEKNGQDRAAEVGTDRKARSVWVCNKCWVAAFGEAPDS